MTVFDDFERIDPNPSYPLERKYIFYNRVQNTEYAKFRNIINKWFCKYPQKNKKKLLADFKVSFDNAFYELLMFTIFNNVGFNVFIEIPDENNSKTPDFLCFGGDDCFYLECTVTDGKSESDIKLQNVKSSIYEMMRKLDTPKFFLNIEKLDLFTNRQPKTKKLIKIIQSKINSLSNEKIYLNEDENHLNKYHKVRFKDEDYEVIVSFLQKNQEFYQNVSHPIGMFPVEAGYVGLEEIIPKALKKKISKYKDLSKPFIVAINDIENSQYLKDDLLWFLYGETTRYGMKNSRPIFTSENAKNLIGVIVTNVFPVNIHKSGLDFYLNPDFENAKKYLSKFDLLYPDPLNSNVFHLLALNNILNIPEDWLDEIWKFN